MKVNIKQLGVDLEIKNNGIELEVSDTGGGHVGDLYINKARLVWCRGKTTYEKGKAISWADFAKYMESL